MRVSDFGIYDEKMPFMVMEFLAGTPLSEVLTHGALPADDTLQIALQLCDALEHAHEKGIFHRDLKPSNILVADGITNKIKIIDFGIATLTAEDNRMHLTKTGEVFGSPLYMSPEQCAGLKADNRSDIYALGCIIYECLTGAPPHVGDTALITMMKHQQDVPLSLKQASLGREFPRGLENIVVKTLAKAPEQRYQTIAVLRHDLQAVRDGKSLNIDGQNQGSSSPIRKAKTGLIIGASLALAVLVAACVVFARSIFNDQPIRVTHTSEVPSIHFTHTKCALAIVDAVKGAPSADLTDCTDIGAEELKRLSNLPNLVELFSLKRRITNEDLAALKGKLDLIALHLRGCNNIDLDGIKHLRAMKGLERLELSGTKIADNCLDELKSFPQLIFLDVQNCESITDNGLRAFLKARPQCVVFASLRDIADPHAPKPSWVAIKAPTSLNALKMVPQTSYVEDLDLGSSKVSDKDAPFIATLPVRFLNLFECKHLTADGIKTILGCESLLNIAAEGTEFDDDDCASVNQRMQEVELSHTHVTNAGVRSLSHCQNLRVIKLRHDRVDASILVDLDALKRLNMLDLEETGISEKQIKSFRARHPRCNVLVTEEKRSAKPDLREY